MRSEVVGKKEENDVAEIMKCSRCGRPLKNAAEAVRSRQSVMCVSCYESLLNPFPKCCTEGTLI
jgi:formylmethanofuran dehydrogenase subunit E